MPRKGWVNICVREEVARDLMRIAEANGLTVSDLLAYCIFILKVSSLLDQNPDRMETCLKCNQKIKNKKIPEHMFKVHAKDIAELTPKIPEYDLEGLMLMYKALYGTSPYGRREPPPP